jgi:hypothetical protein
MTLIGPIASDGVWYSQANQLQRPFAVSKPLPTDRYLSRGERSMPPLFPVARCSDCCGVGWLTYLYEPLA